ncbi:MAG: sigma 54-interacting transcriptional regulator [Polyangiales bacterium]
MSERPHDPHATAIREGVASAPEQSAARFALTVVAGPDQGARVEIDASLAGTLLVGQGPACGLKLVDKLVSRRHLAVSLEGSRLRVTDAGSTNGTAINGLRVVDAYVGGGERITLGDTTLLVARTSDVAQAKLPTAARFGKVIGQSPEIRRLFPLFDRLAKTDVPVVIEGETGTGKEVLAETLHEAGPRAQKPFVVFDCTAVPPTLMESALFGHERGAFTGATGVRRGVFEQAHGGTLFLDEIGDLELSLQPKLLRAIQRGEVQRVGGDKWLKVDVRILSATRRDLDRAVQEGRFRDDLFFRLAVARVELPALRRRSGDVAVLARHFWDVVTRDDDEPRAFPAEFLERHHGYAWPGNVRELYNVVAREVALGGVVLADVVPDDALSLSPTTPIDASPAGDAIAEVLANDLAFGPARERVIAAFERRYVEHLVARFGGNVSRAAAASGLARRYFQLLRAKHAK